MNTQAIVPLGKYRVVTRIWQNGRLIDEQVVCQADSFEQAATRARRITGERVRLNNEDVTVSIEPVPSATGVRMA